MLVDKLNCCTIHFAMCRTSHHFLARLIEATLVAMLFLVSTPNFKTFEGPKPAALNKSDSEKAVLRRGCFKKVVEREQQTFVLGNKLQAVKTSEQSHITSISQRPSQADSHDRGRSNPSRAPPAV
jgi:hypothetical protein